MLCAVRREAQLCWVAVAGSVWSAAWSNVGYLTKNYRMQCSFDFNFGVLRKSLVILFSWKPAYYQAKWKYSASFYSRTFKNTALIIVTVGFIVCYRYFVMLFYCIKNFKDREFLKINQFSFVLQYVMYLTWSSLKLGMSLMCFNCIKVHCETFLLDYCYLYVSRFLVHCLRYYCATCS